MGKNGLGVIQEQGGQALLYSLLLVKWAAHQYCIISFVGAAKGLQERGKKFHPCVPRPEYELFKKHLAWIPNVQVLDKRREQSPLLVREIMLRAEKKTPDPKKRTPSNMARRQRTADKGQKVCELGRVFCYRNLAKSV